MLDFAALDVALGLIFVYLVLALVCSALNETIASALSWRAKFLRARIANLLDPANKNNGQLLASVLYEHPLVNALIRPAGRKGKPRYPSYLPARVFASALLDFDGQGAERSIDKAIAAVPSKEARAALTTLWADAKGDVEAFRTAVESWFDDAMDRVSGWYRRRVQLVMWVLAAAIALSLNVDTIRIANHLWKDRTIRAAVVARTQHPVAGETNPSVTNVAVSVDKLQQLKLPVGWWIERRPSGAGGWGLTVLLKLVGLLMTAAAMTLGAPFWFDVLGKVARIRSSGQIPATTQPPQPVTWSPPASSEVTPVHAAPRVRRVKA
jgi:hypothetical protein